MEVCTTGKGDGTVFSSPAELSCAMCGHETAALQIHLDINAKSEVGALERAWYMETGAQVKISDPKKPPSDYERKELVGVILY
jgi:hypothetical protein